MVKNRHTRTVTSEDPTHFYFQLTNNSDQVQEYELSVQIDSESCSLGDLDAQRLNDPELFTTRWKTSQESGSRVAVAPGKSARVSMLVGLKQSVSQPAWQCLAVLATSNKCSSASRINLRVWMEPDQSDK